MVAISVSGTSSNVQTAASESFLSGGIAASIDITTDSFTSTNHGFRNGLKVQVSTSGSLPTGLSALTNYYLIVVDDDIFKFASSADNASAGTAINLTGLGVGSQTVTPATLDVVVKAMASNDGFLFVDIPGVTASLTGSGNFLLSDIDTLYEHFKIVFQVNAGEITVHNLHVIVKGD